MKQSDDDGMDAQVAAARRVDVDAVLIDDVDEALALLDEFDGLPLLCDEAGGGTGIHVAENPLDVLDDLAIEGDMGNMLHNMAVSDTPIRENVSQGKQKGNYYGLAMSAVNEPVISTDGNSETNDIANKTFDSSKDGDGTATQPATKQNLGRKRLKDELEYLRTQVVELEDQLYHLKHPHGSSTSSPDSTTSSNVSTPPISDAYGANNDSSDFDFAAPAIIVPHMTPQKQKSILLWERIAKHQLDEKQKAEVENLKLREMLEGQLKIARSLEKLLRKRPTHLDDVGLFNEKKRFRHGDVKEASIFELLEREQPRLYSQFDMVWADTGFATNQTEKRETFVRMSQSGNIYMELLDSMIVPFNVEKTSNAVWEFIKMPKMKYHNGVYRALECTEDTTFAEVAMTVRLRRSEALVRVHLLFKRYIEAHCVMFTWASYGDTEGSLLGTTQRINLREMGWCIIQQIEATQATESNVQSSIIQSCIRSMPETDDSSEQQAQAGVITDLIIGSYTKNLQTMHQMVENMLMTDELKSASTVSL